MTKSGSLPRWCCKGRLDDRPMLSAAIIEAASNDGNDETGDGGAT
jgi:hypothetical protein